MSRSNIAEDDECLVACLMNKQKSIIQSLNNVH